MAAHSLPHSGRWPNRRLLWLLVGLIAATGIAVALDRTLRPGTRAVYSAPKDLESDVRALVSGSIPGAILFVRQGDRSYTVTAGYADTASHEHGSDPTSGGRGTGASDWRAPVS